jgi:ubiquinone/menaquinone biosynthesis C-methylase UbiE
VVVPASPWNRAPFDPANDARDPRGWHPAVEATVDGFAAVVAEQIPIAPGNRDRFREVARPAPAVVSGGAASDVRIGLAPKRALAGRAAVDPVVSDQNLIAGTRDDPLDEFQRAIIPRDRRGARMASRRDGVRTGPALLERRPAGGMEHNDLADGQRDRRAAVDRHTITPCSVGSIEPDETRAGLEDRRARGYLAGQDGEVAEVVAVTDAGPCRNVVADRENAARASSPRQTRSTGPLSARCSTSAVVTDEGEKDTTREASKPDPQRHHQRLLWGHEQASDQASADQADIGDAGASVTSGTFERQPLETVIARYSRFARWYRYLEWTILLCPGFRRRAVRRLGLEPGQSVLEVGCGTGRNLKLLRDAVGDGGQVIGLDATPAMLDEAERLIDRHGWSNVTLVRADAAHLTLSEPVDVAYFSLSYSVIPDREGALDRAWEALRPSGRLVIMDAGIPDAGSVRILRRPAELVATVFPGDPYSRPWQDLRRLSATVTTERFQLGLYFICTVEKT